MYWIGVDCHKWQHTAAILDERGQLLDVWQGGTTPADWAALAAWAGDYGPGRWGLEGSGHAGRGLAQFLVAQDAWVAQVNTRLIYLGRRSRGSRHKNDRQDAAAIAALVRQQGERLPRVQREDDTAILALLTAERDDLQAAATRLRNQLHALLAQAEPGQPKARLRTQREVTRWQDYQASSREQLNQVRAACIRRRAHELTALLATIADLGRQLEQAACPVAAPLTELVGVSWLTAGMLAGYLGPGNRFASDCQLAAYAGVAPLEVSSAERTRHRLNREGHRQLNAILHRIALTQLRHSAEAQTYIARRMAEGKSQADALRALKRYIARRVYRLWQCCLDDLTAIATATAEVEMT